MTKLEQAQQMISQLENYSKQDNHFKQVFHSPQNRQPTSLENIEYDVANQSTNINARFTLSKNPNKIQPTVRFHVAENHNMIDVVNQSLNRMTNSLETFHGQLGQVAKMNGLADRTMQLSYANAILNVEKSLAILRSQQHPLKPEHESDFLFFTLAHELSHLSFAHRDKIEWGRMNGLNIPTHDYAHLNSAFYTINRGADKGHIQHHGANLMSTRDEIHSDAAGIYALAYHQMKTQSFDKNKFDEFIQALGQFRHKNVVGSSSNYDSTHNSLALFQPKYIEQIVGMAAQNIKNPNSRPAYNELLNITENAFLETIKQYGVTFAENRLVIHDKFIESMRQSDVSPVSYMYMSNLARTNPLAEKKFDECVKDMNHGFKGSCTVYLNGNQRRVVDTNLDNRLEHTTVLSGLTALNPSNPREQEKRLIAEEAFSFEKNMKLLNVDVKAVDTTGHATVNLSHEDIHFKALK